MPNAWEAAPVIGGGWKAAPRINSQVKKPAPAPSTWDSLKEGAGNLGLGTLMGLADPVYGVSQMALHGANALTGGALNGVTKQYDNFLSGVENQYQSDTKGSVAAGIGRVAGNIAYPVPTAKAKGVGMLVKGARGAMTGTLIGATQPVFNSSDYAKDKLTQVGTGAAIGGGLSAAGAATGAAYNAVRPLVSPKTTVGNQIYKNLNALASNPNPDLQLGAGTVNALTGASPADVLKRLKSAQPLVPGSLPTTAQVAGVPQLVMGEKVLKNNPAYRAAFEDRAIANNKARLQALQSVAKTPEELNAAMEARKAATQPLYDAAMNTTHDIDGPLQSILDRPSAQKALARGRELAQERGDPITPTKAIPGTPAQQTSSIIVDPNGNPFTALTAAQPGTPAQIGGKDLSYLKMGLDDLLNNTERKTGMDSHEYNAITNTHQDLHNWLLDNSPDYAQANQLYAQMSVPINTMQVGQDLYGSLANGTLNAAGDVAPALSIFRNKYAQALKGSPYGIDPDAQKTLDAIQQDLQRETISNSIKSAGSDTAFNMQAPNWLSGQLFGTGLDGSSKLTNGLSGVMGFLHGGPLGALGAAKGSQMLGSFVGNRVNGEFQKAMLEPDYFAQLVEDAAKRNGQPINYLNPSAASSAGAP